MTIQSHVVLDENEWNNTVLALPGNHLLQCWEWGAFKSGYGWKAQHLVWQESGHPVAAAQLLTRSLRLPLLPLQLSISYCPRGPVLDWHDETIRETVLAELETWARASGSLFLKIDPNLAIAAESAPVPPPFLQGRGWRASLEQIQFRNTLLLDLKPSEDALLAAMKQKTRYNIRLAARKGVTVRTGSLDDLDMLYEMYAQTALRDGFAIRHRSYYQDAWGAFMRAGLAQAFIAEVHEEPVAAAILFRFGSTALYMYGMSTENHRQLMPTYLIQWEMIRWAREQGCHIYDFWGAPDTPDEKDPLFGVYRFKTGFNPELLVTAGALDFPVKPVLYGLYTRLLPRIMAVWRRFGHRATSRSLAD